MAQSILDFNDLILRQFGEHPDKVFITGTQFWFTLSTGYLRIPQFLTTGCSSGPNLSYSPAQQLPKYKSSLAQTFRITGLEGLRSANFVFALEKYPDVTFLLLC